MNPRRQQRFLLALALTLVPGSVEAVTVGVGTAVESNSPGGLTVQYMPTSASGAHVAAHLFTDEKFVLNGDYQRFFYPYFTWFDDTFGKLSIYSGLGLRAEARKVDKSQEFYSLRVPLGMQVFVPELFLQTFADVCLQIGDLPQTNLTFAGRIGIRTAF